MAVSTHPNRIVATPAMSEAEKATANDPYIDICNRKQSELPKPVTLPKPMGIGFVTSEVNRL